MRQVCVWLPEQREVPPAAANPLINPPSINAAVEALQVLDSIHRVAASWPAMHCYTEKHLSSQALSSLCVAFDKPIQDMKKTHVVQKRPS